MRMATTLPTIEMPITERCIKNLSPQVEFCAAKARLDEARFAAQTADRAGESVPESLEGVATNIAKLDFFEQVPHTRVQRVEIGRVAGQTLQDKRFGGWCGQELAHGLEAVDGRAIPDDEQFVAGQLAAQMLEKGHAVQAVERTFPHAGVKLAVHGHRCHDREMIVAARGTQNRGVGAGSVGAPHGGQQVKAAFVDKH